MAVSETIATKTVHACSSHVMRETQSSALVMAALVLPTLVLPTLVLPTLVLPTLVLAAFVLVAFVMAHCQLHHCQLRCQLVVSKCTHGTEGQLQLRPELHHSSSSTEGNTEHSD